MFGKLFGASDTVKAAGDLVEKTGSALDNLFTSDEERLTHKELMERLKLQRDELAAKVFTATNDNTTQINALYAKGNLFDRGWRPFIGWSCALALFLFYVPQFAIAAILWVVDSYTAAAAVPYPVSMDDGLWQLVIAMLGMAGIRSLDKAKGTAR